MTETLLPTTVVGSYPQPDWLIDRDKLTTSAAGAGTGERAVAGARALARTGAG